MRWCYLAVLALAPFAALAQPSGSTGVQETYPGPVSASLPGPSLDLNFTNGSPIDSRITYTGGGGTFFNAAGSITAATTNVPRIDYDPVTHAILGLLIEEARTNLALNSATLSTQSVTTSAVAYTLSFYSTGSVALSGSCSGSLAGSGAFPARASLTFTATAGTCTLTVTGSALNGQVEAGSFRTSWISTAGATATRTADVAATPAGAWFNSAAGSLVAEYFTAQKAAAGTQEGVVRLDDGTETNKIALFVENSIGTDVAFVSIGSVTQLSVNSGVPNLNAVEKRGVSYGGSVWRSSLNGGTVSIGSGTNTALPATRLLLGASGVGSTWWLNGYLRRVRAWPRALSSAELQASTT